MSFKYFETFAGTGIGGIALDKHNCVNVGYSEFDPRLQTDNSKGYCCNRSNLAQYIFIFLH